MLDCLKQDFDVDNLNLIVGVDYTRSNLWTGSNTFHGQSLHSTDPNYSPNPYEETIQIIGKKLLKFDNNLSEEVSNFIPVYGFGDNKTRDVSVFSFYEKNEKNDKKGQNENYSKETRIGQLEDVLTRYRLMIDNINLDGPTSFAPIIHKAMEIVMKSYCSYHVLLVIADGQVTRGHKNKKGVEIKTKQEIQTTQAIVEASNLPLSIIIVGVGDNPFDEIDQYQNLSSQQNFENFVFVNFNKVMEGAGHTQKARSQAMSQYIIPKLKIQYDQIQKLGLLNKATQHFQPNIIQEVPPPASFLNAYKQQRQKRLRRNPIIQSSPDPREIHKSKQSSQIYQQDIKEKYRFSEQLKFLQDSKQRSDQQSYFSHQQVQNNRNQSSKLQRTQSNQGKVEDSVQNKQDQNFNINEQFCACNNIGPQSNGIHSSQEINNNQSDKQMLENHQNYIQSQANLGQSPEQLQRKDNQFYQWQQSSQIFDKEWDKRKQNTFYEQIGNDFQTAQSCLESSQMEQTLASIYSSIQSQRENMNLDSTRSQLLSLRHSVPGNLNLLQQDIDEQVSSPESLIESTSYQQAYQPSYQNPSLHNKQIERNNSRRQSKDGTSTIKRKQRRVSHQDLLAPSKDVKRTVQDLVALFELRNSRKSFKYLSEHHGSPYRAPNNLSNAISLPSGKGHDFYNEQVPHQNTLQQFSADSQQQNYNGLDIQGQDSRDMRHRQVFSVEEENQDEVNDGKFLKSQFLLLLQENDKQLTSHQKTIIQRKKDQELSEQYKFDNDRDQKDWEEIKQQTLREEELKELHQMSLSQNSSKSKLNTVRFEKCESENSHPSLGEMRDSSSFNKRRSTQLLTFEEKLNYFTSKDKQMQELLQSSQDANIYSPLQLVNNRILALEQLQDYKQDQQLRALNTYSSIINSNIEMDDNLRYDQIREGYTSDHDKYTQQTTKSSQKLPRSADTSGQSQIDNSTKSDKSVLHALQNGYTHSSPFHQSNYTKRVDIPLLDLDKINGMVGNRADQTQKGWRSLYSNYSITSRSNSRERDSSYRSPFYKQYNNGDYIRLYPAKSQRLPIDKATYYLKQKSLDSVSNSERLSNDRRARLSAIQSKSITPIQQDFPIRDNLQWKSNNNVESPKYSQIYTNNTFLDYISPDRSRHNDTPNQDIHKSSEKLKTIGISTSQISCKTDKLRQRVHQTNNGSYIPNYYKQNQIGSQKLQYSNFLETPSISKQIDNRQLSKSHSDLGIYLSQLQYIIDSNESQQNFYKIGSYDSLINQNSNNQQYSSLLFSPKNDDSPVQDIQNEKQQLYASSSLPLSAEYSQFINSQSNLNAYNQKSRQSHSRNFGFEDLLNSLQSSVESPFADYFQWRQKSKAVGNSKQRLFGSFQEECNAKKIDNTVIVDQKTSKMETYRPPNIQIPDFSDQVQYLINGLRPERFQVTYVWQFNIIDEYLSNKFPTQTEYITQFYEDKQKTGTNMQNLNNLLNQTNQEGTSQTPTISNDYLIHQYPSLTEQTSSQEISSALQDVITNFDYLLESYKSPQQFHLNLPSNFDQLDNLVQDQYFEVKYQPVGEYRIRGNVENNIQQHDYLVKNYKGQQEYQVNIYDNINYFDDFLSRQYPTDIDSCFQFSINQMFFVYLYVKEVMFLDNYIKASTDYTQGTQYQINLDSEYIIRQSPQEEEQQQEISKCYLPIQFFDSSI